MLPGCPSRSNEQVRPPTWIVGSLSPLASQGVLQSQGNLARQSFPVQDPAFFSVWVRKTYGTSREEVGVPTRYIMTCRF